MAPAAIIVLVANPEVIQQRRIERDCIVENLEEISLFQSKEAQQAEYIANLLGIPFLKADSSIDYINIKNFIWSIVNLPLS